MAETSNPPEPSLPCRGCGQRRHFLDERTGERICASCGLVLDFTALETTPTFVRTEEGGLSVSGYGPAQSPYSLRRTDGTVFRGNRDAFGHVLSATRQRQFEILRRRAKEGQRSERHTRGIGPQAEDLTHRVVLALSLPQLVEQAALLVLRKGGEARLFRGRSAAAAAAASVYAACRRYSLPATWTEVSRAAGVTRAEFGRTYMALRRGLNLALPPVGLTTYVKRFSRELRLSAGATGTALTLLDSATNHPDSSGISPNGLVGAVLYMASLDCGEPRRQADVARVTQVTDVTLRNAFRRLVKILGRSP